MIQDYLKAGYPALCILTQEPDRAEQILPCEGVQFYAWDCIRGIHPAKKPNHIQVEIRDPVEAVRWLDGHQDTVLIAHNLHLFLDIPEVVQAIQNGVPKWKQIGSCLVMISPLIQIRPELEKIFTVIDFELPDEQTLFHLQMELAKSVKVEPNPESVRAARGLTEFEAETAFALSLVKTGRFSAKVIAEAKAQMIRKSGLMEFWQPADIADVGGLENLKSYIRNRSKAFRPENEHLPKPKGILLVGIPGSGKSLSCKATASILNWPLIRLDIGALKNSLVGESERRMRQATQVIDAFGESVVWIDETEKAFSGAKSSGETDAGTTAGMFGHFLCWMQETKTPVLIMATANDISKLPPEFMRAGRFDALFFVDLPSIAERKEIVGIMNRKYGTQIPLEYAEKLQGFTGAEIEQLAKDSLFDGLDAAMEAIVPLSRTMREEIQNLRDWARTRARFANSPDEEITEQRKIRSIGGAEAS
jgi:ATP-dependent 26S proteasome regulatory subunit